MRPWTWSWITCQRGRLQPAAARVVQYWLYHWLYQYDCALTVSAVSVGCITGCITVCITVCIMAIIFPHYNLLISTQLKYASSLSASVATSRLPDSMRRTMWLHLHALLHLATRQCWTSTQGGSYCCAQASGTALLQGVVEC